MGKSTEAEDVARFQQKTEYPYRTSYVGAAISSLPAIEKKVIVGIKGADLKLKTDQSVFLCPWSRFDVPDTSSIREVH